MHKYLLAVALLIRYLSPVNAQSDNIKGHDQDAYVIRKADSLIVNYQFLEAITILEQNLQDSIQNQVFLQKLALAHSNLGNITHAKHYYQQILNMDSGNISALNKLGTLYLKEKNYNHASQCYQKLLQHDSTNSYYLKKLAHIKSRQGLLSKAVQLYDSALKYNPQDLESVISLVEIYKGFMEIDDKYEELFQQSLQHGLKLDSLNISLLEIKAKSEYKLRNYKKSIQSLNRIFANHADTITSHAQLMGVCHVQLDYLEDAKNWFELIVNRGEDTELTHYYLGKVFDKIGDNDRAAHHFNIAIEKGISENIYSYYLSLAETYEKDGKLGDAIRAYQEAYQYNPQNILLYKLARNYDKYYRDKRTAQIYYQKFLDKVNRNSLYKEYASRRIGEIKEHLHSLDTL